MNRTGGQNCMEGKCVEVSTYSNQRTESFLSLYSFTSFFCRDPEYNHSEHLGFPCVLHKPMPVLTET